MFKKILALVLALMMCLFALTACGNDGEQAPKALEVEYVKENLMEVISNSINYEEVFGFDPMAEFDQIKSEKVSLTFDLSAIPDAAEMIPFIGLSVAADAKDGYTADIDLNLDMPATFPDGLDARIYLDGDKLVVASDTILGGTYGIEFEESFDAFVEKLENSAFVTEVLMIPKEEIRPALEEAGIDQEYIDGVKAAYDKYIEYSVNLNKKLMEKLNEIAQKCYGEVTQEELDGKAVIAIEENIDKQLVEDVMAVYFDLIKENMEVQQELVLAFVPAAAREDYMSANDPAQIYEQMEQEFMMALDEIEMVGSAKTYLDKETGAYIKSEGAIDLSVDGETGTISFTEYIDNGLHVDMVFDGPEDEDFNVNMLIKYEEKDGIKTWDFSIDFEGDDTMPEDISAQLKADTKAGTYEFNTYVDQENVFGATGTFDIKEKVFAFTLDSITADGETQAFGLGISYEIDPQISAPAEYKNLLTMSVDDAYVLLGTLNEFIAMVTPTYEETYDDEYFYDEDYYYTTENADDEVVFSFDDFVEAEIADDADIDIEGIWGDGEWDISEDTATENVINYSDFF